MNASPNPAGSEDVSAPPRWRRQRWFLLVVAAMLAVAGGIVLRWQVQRRRAAEAEAKVEARMQGEEAEAEVRLQAAMAEAERLDGPWRLADIQTRMAKISDEENSAGLLREIARKMPPRWPSWAGAASAHPLAGLSPPTPLDAARAEEMRGEGPRRRGADAGPHARGSAARTHRH